MRNHNVFEPAFAREALPTERVDVWTVALAAGADEVASHWECLSADERDRAARFAFERDRRRFVVGRGALRRILASYLDGRPGLIRFVYGEHGKPMLAEGTERRSVEFNASGSEDLAVCAVTVGRKLGVDIELSRPVEDEAFLEECFAPAERDLFRTLSPAQRRSAFYRLWTIKEAYLKATGAGLSRPLCSVEVAFMPGERARLLVERPVPDARESWTFVEFSPGPEYVGALVVAGPAPSVEYRRWPL